MKRRSLRQRVKRALSELFGNKQSLYPGVAPNRLNWEWIMSPVKIDDEILSNMVLLREAGRQICRSGSYGKGFLNLLSVNVLGTAGPRLQSRVRLADDSLDAATNKTLERAWKEWREDAVSIDGTMDFQTFSNQQIRTLAREGEAFVRLWRGVRDNKYRLGLEAFDPDWIDHTYNVDAGEGRAQVRLGIELDGMGKPTAFYQRKGVNGKRARIDASEIIHVYIPERIGQRRGLSWFASVIQPMRNLTGYTDAELVAARISASKMGFFTNPTGEAAVDTSKYADQPQTMEAAAGQFEVLPPGYGFESFDADHPSTAFGDFVKSILREIATGLGVSYNSYANDLEGVNYSSMRSGLLTEREVWRSLQAFWIFAYQRKVYRAWLQMATLSGALPTLSNDWREYDSHIWTPRGWLWVDPLKDVTAAEKAIALGLTSRTAQLSDQGLDFEEVVEQLAEEQKIADRIGVNIGGAASKATDPAADPNAEDDAADNEDDATNGNGNGNGNGGRSKPVRIRYGRLSGGRIR